MTLITDNDQYKLGIEVNRTEHYIHVQVLRWLPEMEWMRTDMFLSEDEYLALCRALV